MPATQATSTCVLITREEAIAAGCAASRQKSTALRGSGSSARPKTSAPLPTCSPAAPPSRPPVTTLSCSLSPRRSAPARETHRELSALGGEPAGSLEQQAEAPRLAPGFDIEQAQQVRDLWQGLTQMANARGPEAEAIAQRLAGVDAGHVLRGFANLIVANRDNERRLEQARARSLTSAAGDLAGAAREIGGIRLLATRVDGVDGKELRDLADRLRDKMGSGVLCLGGKTDDKATLLVAVTKDLTGRLQAGGLIKELAPLIGGRGGGKPSWPRPAAPTPKRSTRSSRASRSWWPAPSRLSGSHHRITRSRNQCPSIEAAGRRDEVECEIW